MAEALPLRIFLASPGDVSPERELLRRGVAEYNEGRGALSNVSFDAIGWESVRGTARRPQEAINELIGESHFLVALFRSSWGSEPGGHWGYTSGTEEELFTGLLGLGQEEHPMRDIWVVFLEEGAPDGRITELRDAIKDRHALLYDVATNADHLKELFSQRLEAWEPLAGTKLPRQIDLLPSSGKDVLGAQRLRINGEKLVDLGQVGPGRDALREAAGRGGPAERLACAKFESRHGDLARAIEEVQQAIEEFTSGRLPLRSPLAAEAFAAEAGLLRQEGRNVDAIGRLEHALTLLDEADPYGAKVRCRILDDLGLAHKATGDAESARTVFERALNGRRERGAKAEIAQSLVNLARLEIGAGNLDLGTKYAEQAAEGVRGMAPTGLHANIEALFVQVRRRQGRADQGLLHAQRSLSINRQLGNRHGEAIALYVLAQCHWDLGQITEARDRAQECRQQITYEDLTATKAVRFSSKSPDRTETIHLTADSTKYRHGIDNKSYPNTAPILIHQGERLRLRIVNDTMMFHPIHLHGHTFQMVSAGSARKDTVNVLPMSSVDVDIDADNPGQWMLHCHNTYHFESGMATTLSYRS